MMGETCVILSTPCYEGYEYRVAINIGADGLRDSKGCLDRERCKVFFKDGRVFPRKNQACTFAQKILKDFYLENPDGPEFGVLHIQSNEKFPE